MAEKWDGTERWLPVVGFEGFNEVSNCGRVRSLDRVVPAWHGSRRVRGRVLKQTPNARGYLQVTLWREGVRTQAAVHSLVAEAFIGQRPFGQEVRHGPAGKRDNGVTNLSYGTTTENAADRVRDGTALSGSRNHLSKMTDEVVRDCRSRYAAGGVTMSALAVEVGVDKAAMRRAIRGITWRHVDA